MLGGISKVGGHHWYKEGTRYILARQGRDGEWRGTEGLADHCFALLFLKRAYVGVATPGAKPPGTPKPDTPTHDR